MASRAIGAMLALVAAMLFAVSLASPVITTGVPAWFDGHPVVDGKERVIQDVHVGPFGAKGCNEHGCASLDGVSTQFRIMGYAEGVIVGLGVIFALVLALASWRVSDRRKSVAVCSLLVAILCAGGAAVLIWQGPDIKSSQRVEIPIGIGIFMFGGGVIAMGIASVATLASRQQPLRLKSRVAPQVPPDLRQIVRDQHDALRPSSLGPEPKMGARDAAGPHGSQPLFEQAPQLRPLYEMQGGGAPAVPHVNLPTRAPTPIPRASIGMIAGIPTPPAFDAAPDPRPTKSPTLPPQSPDPTPYRAKTPSSMPRTNPPTTPPADPPARTSSPSVPPSNPPRTKSASVPPSNPPRDKSASVPPSNPPRDKSASVPPSNPPRDKSASVPPSNPPAGPPRSKSASMPPATNPPPRAKAASTSPPSEPSPAKPTPIPPRLKAASIPPPSEPPVKPTPMPPRAKGPSVPPPEKPSRGKIESAPPPSRLAAEQALKRANPTIAAAVAPPPDHRASAPRLDSESEVTGMENVPLKGPVTAVEIDAAGKAAAKAAEAKRHGAQAARVAAEEEARRRNADMARIAEAKRREAEERAAEDEAIAKRRAARLLTGDNVDTNTDAEVGERKSELQLSTGETRALSDDDISTPRQAPNEDDRAATDGVQLAMRRAPSATPVEPLPIGGNRPITDGPVIEQPPPVAAPAQRPPIAAATRPPIGAARAPISTAPTSLPPPKNPIAVTSGPTPACPQCEAPMAWVEEHLRFYCRSCRMYF